MSFGTIFLPPEARLQPNFDKFYHQLVEDEIRSKLVPPSEEDMKKSQDLSRLFATGTDSENVLTRIKSKTKKKKQKKHHGDSNKSNTGSLVQDTLTKILEANEDDDDDEYGNDSGSGSDFEGNDMESSKKKSIPALISMDHHEQKTFPLHDLSSIDNDGPNTSLNGPSQYSISPSLLKSTVSLTASLPSIERKPYTSIRGIKEKHLSQPHLLSINETIVHNDRIEGGKFHIDNTIEPYEEAFQVFNTLLFDLNRIINLSFAISY